MDQLGTIGWNGKIAQTANAPANQARTDDPNLYRGVLYRLSYAPPWQDLGSYQDFFRLVTMYTHIDWIVLPHWETNQVASTMIWYPTQSQYPDTELSSPFSNLVMSSIRLGGDMHNFCKAMI